jgi:spore germination cell wall hydrolase CwlJ-like protein
MRRRAERALRGSLSAGLLGLALAQLGEAQAGHSDAHCLALSMYFEARDDGRAGMEAVGWVILNRLENADFPSSVCAVVEDGGEAPPCQFTWWCDGKSDEPEEGEAWQLAREVADELLTDPPPDPTDHALFFHSKGVDPSWEDLERTAEIGTHVFYR